MEWTAPTIEEFKAKFKRDFPYAPENDADNLDFITDDDIQAAIDEASLEFNSSIFGDSSTTIFLYLAAYHLVQNIQTSTRGLSAQASFVLESTGVGSVNVSNKISGRFSDDPAFSSYLKNAYGQKYIELAYPYTIGNVETILGETTYA